MSKQLRVNQEIRVPVVRLVENENSRILPIRDALQEAKEEGLDLVEVSPNAQPPVCKLMDYGKFLYEKKKSTQKTQGSSTSTIQLRPSIGPNDLQTKINQMRAILDKGDRVKVLVQFKGREITHKELGQALLTKITTEINAELLSPPTMEGRNLTMTLSPKKNGGKSDV